MQRQATPPAPLPKCRTWWKVGKGPRRWSISTLSSCTRRLSPSGCQKEPSTGDDEEVELQGADTLLAHTTQELKLTRGRHGRAPSAGSTTSTSGGASARERPELHAAALLGRCGNDAKDRRRAYAHARSHPGASGRWGLPGVHWRGCHVHVKRRGARTPESGTYSGDTVPRQICDGGAQSPSQRTISAAMLSRQHCISNSQVGVEVGVQDVERPTQAPLTKAVLHRRWTHPTHTGTGTDAPFLSGNHTSHIHHHSRPSHPGPNGRRRYHHPILLKPHTLGPGLLSTTAHGLLSRRVANPADAPDKLTKTRTSGGRGRGAKDSGHRVLIIVVTACTTAPVLCHCCHCTPHY
jgi:hypothetical protein